VYRTGLSIVPVVPWEGAPDQLPNFYHVWRRRRWLKKVVNFLGE